MTYTPNTPPAPTPPPTPTADDLRGLLELLARTVRPGTDAEHAYLQAATAFQAGDLATTSVHADAAAYLHLTDPL